MSRKSRHEVLTCVAVGSLYGSAEGVWGAWAIVVEYRARLEGPGELGGEVVGGL